MARVYYELIKQGRITIDDVLPRWRAAVEKLLESEGEK